MTGSSCSACDMGLSKTGGGKRRGNRSDKMFGGAGETPNEMFGGATTTNLGLNPASLTGDSFDKNADSLSNAAYSLYLKQSHDLASLKNVNAMAGGKKKRSRTAKKYRSKSKSRQQRGGETTREKAGYILDSPRTEQLCEGYPKIKAIVDELKEANSKSRTPFDKKSEKLIEQFRDEVKKQMEEEEGQAGGRGQRGGILELGALLNEAAVPLTLLVAQQKYKQRTTKGYKGKVRKSRKFRSSRRR